MFIIKNIQRKRAKSALHSACDRLSQDVLGVPARLLYALGFLLMAGAGYAQTADEPLERQAEILAQEEEASNSDPYEASNRAVYEFNNFLDRAILLPSAKTYSFLTPDFMQTGTTNFFNNIGEPYNMFNNVLQLKLLDAYTSLARFSINSIFGLFGLIDVASHMGLERQPEDLGQTLGVWGAPPGRYLVIPFLGSSTERDFVPRIVSFFYSPTSSLYTLSTETSIALTAIDVIDTRNNLRQLETIVFGDAYTYVRDAYLQNREYQVWDGRLPTDNLWLYQEIDEDLEELDELDNLDELGN